MLLRREQRSGRAGQAKRQHPVMPHGVHRKPAATCLRTLGLSDLPSSASDTPVSTFLHLGLPEGSRSGLLCGRGPLARSKDPPVR